MNQDIREYLGKQMLFFDGGCGTYLQGKGLAGGEVPETWNLTKPEIIVDMHKAFLRAGANIVLTCTFGANDRKFEGKGFETEEVVRAAVRNARRAVDEINAEDGMKAPRFVSVDIGPLGQLMAPMGELTFESAYEMFKKIAVWAEDEGADLASIETMNDIYESKAAILAVKENTNLPITSTITLNERAKTLTGTDPFIEVAVFEDLGVDALGINCGLGPMQMDGIVEDLVKYANVAVAINPNAGLPVFEDGEFVYDIDTEQFSDKVKEFAEKGAWLVGGCCGTTPEHIGKVVEKCKDIKPLAKANTPAKDMSHFAVSYSSVVDMRAEDLLVGERLDASKSPDLAEALSSGNMRFAAKQAMLEKKDKVDLIKVNLKACGSREAELLTEVIRLVQGGINIPMVFEVGSPEAKAAVSRAYNGKPYFCL